MSATASIKEVQISFRTLPENKRLARIEAAKLNMSLNEWIKHLVESNLNPTASKPPIQPTS